RVCMPAPPPSSTLFPYTTLFRSLYEVPVHADIPHQQVIFLDETDPLSSPMKAKGVAELGICGVAAAVANAIYNATGVRVREYPRSEEHTSELQSRENLVCRLLLE